ncbi:PAS domain S-box protein [Oscillatoria sp. FACHB-1407]|uniref:histidine kinase dimerization/phosphoacceptor domain -containing protein n=1 Tax=Oscillatoria sp. FACHB-1407 TaxID=2692847 RepID=UPI0016844FA7|nr:histidine kinase dimerization/phosphoacceptor domain -containing protein [Oscillatoria sp. FACHB-1407]MBD2461008.1 PAS domain S-box protein [Oscillatoria sp. FACHB-1407]
MLHDLFVRLHQWGLIPQKVPLRSVLITPFVVQTIAIVGLVSYLSLQSGHQAVANLAGQLTNQLSDRVHAALTTRLEISHQINRLNATAVRLNQIDPQQMTTLEPHLMAQLTEFDTVTSIAFATERGDWRSVDRQQGLRLVAVDADTPNQATIYQSDADGDRLQRLETTSMDDVRQSQWYLKAIETGEPGWSDLFHLENESTLAVNAYYPVLDPKTERPLGVFSVNLNLNQIDLFLKQLLPNRFGEVYIVERNGLMVASSTNRAASSVSPDTDRHPPLNQIRQAVGNLAQIDKQQQFVMQVNEHPPASSGWSNVFHFPHWGDRHYVEITPFQTEWGLDWLIVLTVPETAFAQDIISNAHMTMLLCAGALVGAITLGVTMAECIARPMHHLSDASQAIASGKLNQQIDSKIIVNELRIMAQSFNQMATQVQQAFDQIKIALQESEEKFTKIFRCSPDAISITSFSDGRFLEVNDSFLKNYGYTREEVIGHTSLDLGLWQQGGDRDWFVTQLNQVGRLHNSEFQVRTKLGDVKTVLFSAEIIDLEGETCVLAVRQDISDRKKAADQLRASLQEKEVLLSEIHHRVKNNLQIVSSLLDLQANRTHDSQSREILANSCSRVFSMALVHECLYRSQNFAEINFANYAHELANHLLSTYKTHSDFVSLSVNIDPKIVISLKQAIPCGLMLNELVTNALKYGLSKSQSRQIYITLKQEQEHLLTLVVGHDGDTLPENFTLEGHNTSMGIRLILTLVEQLEGSIDIQRGEQTLFKVTFPIHTALVT